MTYEESIYCAAFTEGFRHCAQWFADNAKSTAFVVLVKVSAKKKNEFGFEVDYETAEIFHNNDIKQAEEPK